MTSRRDRQIIGSLAARVREVAEHPDMIVRKDRWYRHNSLESGRALVLCFPEGAWRELVPESTLQCEDPQLRRWEHSLRMKIYWWQHIRDDNALEPSFNIPWTLSLGDYGIPTETVGGDNGGSYRFERAIYDLKTALPKLHGRRYEVDRNCTRQAMERASALFGDVLPPRLRRTSYEPISCTWEVIRLIGMQEMFVLMYDDPASLHGLMKLISDDKIRYFRWLEQENLLTLNNEDDYVGTGGVGYCRELPGVPRPRDVPGEQPVLLADTWGFADSQETIGVSPDMFNEFVMQYQKPLLELFGLSCYGCCEPVHDRWRFIKAISNLRRVSVSPWCDQQLMAEHLGSRYIFSRKPNPALVCTTFDEETIRADIRQTLSVARDCVVEIILKDTHTVQKDPRRIHRWVEIALDEARSA